MARIRHTKPEFWTSDRAVRVSRDARLLHIGMWNFMDANGVHPAKALTLRLEVFPGDADVTDQLLEKWIGELKAAGSIVEYEVAGKRYWWSPGFREHQIIRDEKPKYPPPPQDLQQKLQQSCGGTDAPVQQESGASAAPLQHGLGTRDLVLGTTPPTPSESPEEEEAGEDAVDDNWRPVYDGLVDAGVMYPMPCLKGAQKQGHTPATALAVIGVYVEHEWEIGHPGKLHHRLVHVPARAAPHANWPKKLTIKRDPAKPDPSVLRERFYAQGREAKVPDHEIERMWQARLAQGGTAA